MTNNATIIMRLIRVMLVEDDSLAVQGIRSNLSEAEDVRLVAVVTQPDDALKAYIEYKPEVLLLDILFKMEPTHKGGPTSWKPKGLDVACKIRAYEREKRKSHPPVAIIGISHDPDYIFDLQEFDPMGFIEKVDTAFDIAPCIRTVAAGNECFQGNHIWKAWRKAQSQHDVFDRLDDIDRQIILYFARDRLTPVEIADRIDGLNSSDTLHNRLSKLYGTLADQDVRNGPGLVAWAYQEGFIKRFGNM